MTKIDLYILYNQETGKEVNPEEIVSCGTCREGWYTKGFYENNPEFFKWLEEKFLER